jgi:hypothetical protein
MSGQLDLNTRVVWKTDRDASPDSSGHRSGIRHARSKHVCQQFGYDTISIVTAADWRAADAETLVQYTGMLRPVP